MIKRAVPMAMVLMCACSLEQAAIYSDSCFLVTHGDQNREWITAIVTAATEDQGVNADRSSPSSINFYTDSNSLIGSISFGPPGYGDIVALYHSTLESKEILEQRLRSESRPGLTVRKCEEVFGLVPPAILDDPSLSR